LIIIIHDAANAWNKPHIRRRKYYL